MSMTISTTKIICAIIFDFLLGGFWYSNSGFAKPWMIEAGLTETKIQEEMKKGNIGRAFIIQIFLNICGVIGQVVLLNALKPANILESILYSLGIWLAFCAPGHVRSVLWEFKRVKYFFINSGYKFVSILVLSVLFSI